MTELKLKKLGGYKPYPGPLVLAIMDGIGLGKQDESNGWHAAKTPVLDALLKEKLFTQLKAHGRAVGLPTDDDMGNSEVGHNALGAGRVFSQGAMLVNDALSSGKIFEGNQRCCARVVGRVPGPAATVVPENQHVAVRREPLHSPSDEGSDRSTRRGVRLAEVLKYRRCHVRRIAVLLDS